ncbi:hypothetical protein VTK73DRAFT_8958 [Phialemonium thermophilum]|uniref:tRNA(Phe) 7-[(3-amino-3-carboxypropyl)-4-demethylwyosine(37)-N(4)]-methyltransferase n=1 Tax=Phialemonium thermophilum TaxID=223376 RepID=A0ABR3Y634_9PEZI
MATPTLPKPSPDFDQRKAEILKQLSLPASAYTDASPKGTVDECIRELIDEINGYSGLVTTSSCAGRLSIFLEGDKTSASFRTKARKPASNSGGKGGGGSWLFVSHDPVTFASDTQDEGLEFLKLIGLEPKEMSAGLVRDDNNEQPRLIHFKFEPMILHILTASVNHAELVLKCGLQAGFRESGAINLLKGRQDNETAKPIVAIRSMGLSLESIIGVESYNKRRCIVAPDYLLMLLRIANERFSENRKRIKRFRESLNSALGEQNLTLQEDLLRNRNYRRDLNRAEGLRRQEELQKNSGRRRDNVDLATEEEGCIGDVLF